jgi:murein DD-endopeptidase MepM/ murein hydrolase activator NlpD
MNIIIVPGSKHGKGQNASLTQWHLLAIIALVLVALPVTVGVVTYRIQAMLDSEDGGLSTLAKQERALAAQRAVVDRARRDAESHLNALALKLGQLQAQVLRLNALGSRLTRMAGLDQREFNFREDPAMGGPEKKIASGAAAGNDVITSLETVSNEIDRQRERLVALESLLLYRRLSQAVTPSGWPVEGGGWVSSGFGPRVDPFTGDSSFHDGLDIAARYGSPILAVADGVVTFAGADAGYGNLVEVTHESGLVTRYAHASAILAKVGDRVRKGQEIARVGSTGRSTGPHVHFMVVKDGRPVDPVSYLKSERVAKLDR